MPWSTFARRTWLIALLIAALLAAACSSDSGDEVGAEVGNAVEAPSVTATATPTPTPEATPVPFDVGSASVEGPVTEPNAPNIPQPEAPLPDGYVLEEFFISGDASSFELVGEAADDGRWSAQPADTAEYRTRVLVRRPAAEDFSGVVIVEWLNVTSVESSPDWGYLFEEIGRAGHAYVAVSAQAQGVEGGGVVIEVDVDKEAAEAAGQDPADADTSGLVNIDPDRYGTLSHPGDDFAYDIYGQVGLALHESADTLLGGQEPETVVAIGESQSAAFLSTYINAVHPLEPVYDAFLVHSRGAGISPVSGQFARGVENDATAESFVTEGVTIRTDLAEPVFIFESETDLSLLGYANARQDDTDSVRTWEVAGTAHSDAHVFRVFLGGPRDPMIAQIIGCTNPINVGPHHETIQAALSHLIIWAQEGTAPPTGARLEVTIEEGELPAIVRDKLEMAIGGVRNPLVDVPAFVPTGEPATPIDLGGSSEGFDVCNLFGTTIALDQAELLDLHGSVEQYLAAFEAATEEAVADGFLLPTDAEQLLEEARNDFAPLFG